MEGLGDFGLLVNKVGQDNVYQNLLASIDRENLSGSSITVAVVHALSKKVEWVGDQLTGWGGPPRTKI